MFAFVVFVFIFSAKPRDWLGRTSPKWLILCRVGRKTLTQSINQLFYFERYYWHDELKNLLFWAMLYM